MPDRYAVIGQPIQHSLSPAIHRAFAKQVDHNILYEAIEANPENFKSCLLAFRNNGGKGVNITAPHKQSAYQIASSHDAAAKYAEAVNTLLLEKEHIRSANTDGAGLYRDLTARHNIDLAEQSILLLGAGGAARGVVHELLQGQPNSLHIANRHAYKAKNLQKRFDSNLEITVSDLENIPAIQYSLIINATSASLQNINLPLSKELFGQHTFCYDMVYAKEDTIFMRYAAECGANGSADGLGMLIEQAAEAFYLWRGVRPSTESIYNILRSRT